MVTKTLEIQATHIQSEAEWFIHVLNARLQSYFDTKTPEFTLVAHPPPNFEEESLYTDFIEENDLGVAERLILMLALMPHIQPQVLDVFFTRNEQFDRGYTEFGGVKGNFFSGFFPTGETAMFLLAANNLYLRQHYMAMFEEDHVFAANHILWLDNPHKNEPFLSGVLCISDEIVDFLSTGRIRKPRFNVEFPASKISTGLSWDDLILENATLEHLNELIAWIDHGHTLLDDWELGKKLKPGYKSLFYGPSGTGKTLTATLIGKQSKREVYRIDLSMIVSKYIGETEKNLSKVFDKAASKEWILFFDEADALFGKRTNVGDSHDRYANQEVSFLLQKVEEHNGLVILATNLKSNIDDAFTRRFQSIIHFPMPKPNERLLLWKQAFSAKSKLDEKVNLQQVADNYELAGGSIVNVVRYASLMALRNNTNIIQNNWILTGIKKEFQKVGKTI